MSNAELTCEELVKLVTDYLEHVLLAPEVARFEAHLAGCTGCTNYLEQARQTIDVTGHLAEDSLSPPRPRRTVECIPPLERGRQTAVKAGCRESACAACPQHNIRHRFGHNSIHGPLP